MSNGNEGSRMPVEPKSGWRTTEFWATVAASLVAILNGAFQWNLPTESIVGIATAVAAYVLGRSWVKHQ